MTLFSHRLFSQTLKALFCSFCYLCHLLSTTGLPLASQRASSTSQKEAHLPLPLRVRCISRQAGQAPVRSAPGPSPVSSYKGKGPRHSRRHSVIPCCIYGFQGEHVRPSTGDKLRHQYGLPSAQVQVQFTRGTVPSRELLALLAWWPDHPFVPVRPTNWSWLQAHLRTQK